MNLINALIKSGFMSESASDLTNKQNHIVVKDAYYNMIYHLNYVFCTIPNRVDMLCNPTEFAEIELKNNLEEEYDKFQNLLKKVVADFNQCSFLYCYLLLTHKEGIIIGDDFKEKLLTMFQSFNKHHPHYQYDPLLSAEQTNSKNIGNKSSNKTLPKKKPDPRESKLNFLHEFYGTTISNADSNIKSFLDEKMVEACLQPEKFEDESEQEYRERVLKGNKKLMYWNKPFFQSHIKDHQFDTLIDEYKKLYSVYEKITQSIINKYYNFVLLQTDRFSEMNQAEVDLLCYLFQLQSKHSEISLKKNQQKWTLLSIQEREQLATLVENLDDEVLRKYYVSYDPYVPYDQHLYLVEDIRPQNSRLSHDQMNYILRVLADCPESTFEENPKLYDKLSDTIRKAYGLYLRMQPTDNPKNNTSYQECLEENLNTTKSD